MTATQAPRSVLFFEPSIGANVLSTTNSGLVTSDQGPRRDVVLDVLLDVALRVQTARFTLAGDLGVDLVGYANHTQKDEVLPKGRLDLNTTLVENNLFLDAGIQASRNPLNPFQAQLDGGSTVNTLSTMTYRVSPYFSHEFSDGLSAEVRSDNVLSRSFSSADSGVDVHADFRTQTNLLRVEKKPTPLGLMVELSREDTYYRDLEDEALRVDTGRAIASVALSSELIVGAIGGRDHSVYPGGDISGARYGGSLHWRPSNVTRLDAEVEHRFFGTGWDVRLQHRTPLSVFELTMGRSADATPATLGTLAPGSDLTTLLNSLLVSSIPNPNDRSVAVQNLISSRGLSNQLSQPIDIFSEAPQVNQRVNATLLINGARDTLQVSVSYLKSQALDQAAGFSVPTSDTVQHGATFALNRRLAPDTTGTVSYAWSSVRGLDSLAGSSTIQRQLALSLNRNLSPKSTLAGGVRRLTSSGTAGDVNETGVFAGIKVRF